MTRRAKRGIAQVNLSLKDVGNFSIPLPPIKQQERFAEFVNQVDKLRFDASSLNELSLRIIYQKCGNPIFDNSKKCGNR